MTKSEHPSAVRSRGLLTNALLALLEERSYTEITVTELCDRAGVARKTFYRNFSGKDQVVEDYLDGLCAGFLSGMERMGAYSHEGFAHCIFSFWRPFAAFLKRLDEQGQAHFFQRKFDEMVPLLGRYYPGGGDGPFARYCEAYVAGGCQRLICAWVEGGAVETPEEMARYYAAMRGGESEVWEHDG